MRYFGNASSPPVRDAMRAGVLDQIVTPAEGKQVLEICDESETVIDCVPYIADNGVFSLHGKPFNQDRWFTWLSRIVAGKEHRCVFAVAPDVFNSDLGYDMGRESLMYSRRFLADIRCLGVPAAVVAQNGLTPQMLAPFWHEFDALFLGGCKECVPCGWVPDMQTLAEMNKAKSWPCGSCGVQMTEWKLSRAAHRLALAAKPEWRPDADKHVHMGRLNSGRRWRRAEVMGCDSGDGTFLAKGPNQNLIRLGAWPDDNLFAAVDPGLDGVA